jgi:hypothetical protein
MKISIFLLVFILCSCSNDVSKIDNLTINYTYVSDVAPCKIANCKSKNTGFVAIIECETYKPIIYKVQRPRKGFMDGIYMETRRQEYVLGFDETGFNQIKVPQELIGKVVLVYSGNNDEWKEVELVNGTFDLDKSIIPDQENINKLFKRIKADYNSYRDSIP